MLIPSSAQDDYWTQSGVLIVAGSTPWYNTTTLTDSCKPQATYMSGDTSHLSGWLSRFLERNGGVAGTVHFQANQELQLVASVNIPLNVQELTVRIPKGKGMAGLAWERGEPVQTCNLKTDSSGDVRPGARAVDAQGAVALPVRAKNGEIRAVVGIAFADERELHQEELRILTQEASSLP